MNATMRKRIERAEAILIRPEQTFTRTVLIGQPPEDAGAQAWADHERAIARAQEAGERVIVLVPLRPRHEAPSLRG